MQNVAIVPIKLRNRRLPGKNLMPLADGSTLLHRAVTTLGMVRGLDRVIVFSSSKELAPLVRDLGAEHLLRNPRLDEDSASSNDILSEFTDQVRADRYVLVHATSPFLRASSVEAGLEAMAGDYDSAFTAVRKHDFFWVGGVPNYDPRSIPRTQDLEPLLIETSGFYAFESDVFRIGQRRIGDNPYVVEVSSLEAVDVDEQEDMDIANALIERLGM